MSTPFSFDSFLREADKIFSTYTLKSIDDLSEAQLKAALERKVKEKERKLTRKEQMKIKLKELFKDEVEFEIHDDSTKQIATLTITKPFSATCALHLEDGHFFT